MEHRILVFAAASRPQRERHTIAKSFETGSWRVAALQAGFNTSADSHT
ncbi:hypothetical protein [Streptomyces sp. NPDC020489]